MTTENTTNNAKVSFSDMAKAFAKANKVSCAKVQALLDEALMVALEAKALAPKTPRGTQGRKSSERSLEDRKAITERLAKAKGERLTSKQIAAELNINQVNVNNILNSLAKSNIVYRAGELKEAGQPGRASVVWGVK